MGDEEHKIRYDLLRQRTLLVFHTAWELANRPGRVKVDVGVGGWALITEWPPRKAVPPGSIS